METNLVPAAMETDAEPEDVASASEDNRYDVIICHTDSETKLATVLANSVRSIGQEGRPDPLRVEILGNLLHLGSQTFEALNVIDDVPIVMFFRTKEFFKEKLNGFAVGAAIEDRLKSFDKDKHWTVCPIDVGSTTRINFLFNSINGVTLGSLGELNESAKENIKKLLIKKLPRVRSCPGPSRGLQDEIAAGRCRQIERLQSIAQCADRGTENASPPDSGDNESSKSQTSGPINTLPNFQTDSPPVNGEGGTPEIIRDRQLSVAASGSQGYGPVMTEQLSQTEAGEVSRVVTPDTRSGCETPVLDSIALYATPSSTYYPLPSHLHHLPQSVVCDVSQLPANCVPYQAPPYQQYRPENAFVPDNAPEFPHQSPQQHDLQQQLRSNLGSGHVPSATASNRRTVTQQQQWQHQACQQQPQTYSQQTRDNCERPGAPPNGARPKECSGQTNPQNDSSSLLNGSCLPEHCYCDIVNRSPGRHNSNMFHVTDARRSANLAMTTSGQQSANCMPHPSVTGHGTHRCSEASPSVFTDPQPRTDVELLNAMENLRMQSLTPPLPDKVDRGSMEGQDLSSRNSHSVDLTVDGSVLMRNSMTDSLQTVPNCPIAGIHNSPSRNSS